MAQCERKKCGEYNMLRCARSAGHDGDCSFVVDHENDYPHNKKRKVGTGDTPAKSYELPRCPKCDALLHAGKCW